MSTLLLPTFAIAPEGRGRGYELYSAENFRGSWTLDLPMVMLAWSQLVTEGGFAVCFDIGVDGLLVCRGRFIKQYATGDAVALLFGVHVSNAQFAMLDYRTDLLAASLAEPHEGSDFGQGPHAFEIPEKVSCEVLWPELQLGWCDRFIKCSGECDRLALLQVAFESVYPVGGRARVRSWATVDTLPGRGSIDLAGQAQLLFGSDPAPLPDRFLLAEVEGRRLDDGSIGHMLTNIAPGTAPESFGAYCDMLEIVSALDSEYGTRTELEWEADFATLGPDVLAQRLAIRLVGSLKLTATFHLLISMLDHEQPGVREGGRRASLKVLERLMERGRFDEKTLPLVERLFDSPELFKLILGGKGLGHQNTKMLIRLAKIASEMVRKIGPKRMATQSQLADFTVQLSQLAAHETILVDSALTLSQSWHDESLQSISGVLTSETAGPFARRDEAAFRLLVGRLMRSDFLSISGMTGDQDARARVGAALATLDSLSR